VSALEFAAKRQAAWSVTANRLKAIVDRARWTTFGLSILGAVLATVASQLQEGSDRKAVAIAGAIVLSVATFINLRFGSTDRSSAWAKARAAAEGLKREVFKFVAGAAPYDVSATADGLLEAESAKIEDGVTALTNELVESPKAGSAPTSPISHADYIQRRVRGQIDGFYRPKADRFRVLAARLRVVEMVFALLAAVLTAVVGVLKKYPVTNFRFDLAALTSIFTTIGATVLAHIQAERYDFLVTTYRATARRLEQALLDIREPPPLAPADWSAFVERCESIIAAENQSWVAKFAGP
jgi:hypothetical protein